MKKTNIRCPICNNWLMWDDNTTTEIHNPKDDENYKDAVALKCYSCWTEVVVAEDMFKEVNK